VEQKTELVKNLISNARIVLTLDAKESEFRADLTKTDFKILDQLLKNPREKIDSISKSIMLSTKTVTRAIEKFEKNPAIQFTVIYDPRKLGKFIAFAVLAMVQSNIKKVKKEIETSFGDYFWQVPFAAKELLVLFMYSENLYDADTMHHKIKEIDGVAFTEVFFPKKIMMPTNWISRSAQNAARSEKFHSFSENRWAFDTSTLENLDETRWDLFLDPTNEKPISAYQLHYLKILNYDGSPPKTKGEASQLIADLRYHWKDKEPTQEQKSYLKKLGYKGLPPKHRGDASNLISKLLYQKGDKITEDIIPYLIYGESKTTKRSWRDSLD
jgi:DNA-binding Lrp family transcriptional regulator